MQLLSSSITPFTKFILPGLFIAGCPAWIAVAAHQQQMMVVAIIWHCGCAFLLWWTFPIKKVTLVDDHFVISNYRREIRVPTSQLVRVHEERWNRTPSITLFFDPPTSFGKKIRIIPSIELFSRREYDRVAELLRGMLGKRSGA